MEENKQIKQLAEAFDLEYPKYTFVISGYHSSPQGMFISQIKVLDSKGNFIKFANIEKVIWHLSKYPVKFEDRNESR